MWDTGRAFQIAAEMRRYNLEIVLSNRLQAFRDLLNEGESTIENNWKGIIEAITSTCHEVMGHKKHHHKEWITVDTLDKIQERRNKKAAINTSRRRTEKAKAQAEYTEVKKQVKKSIRADKRKYVEDLATTAEKSSREGNMRRLYDITKKLSGNRRKPERPVKNKEGEVITNTKEQRNRWIEHFKELLNRPAPLNPPNIEAAPTDLSIDTSTSEGKHVINWTTRMKLDDLDFGDDMAFLSQAQQQMQQKTTSMAAASAAVGLNIHKEKGKILRYNTVCTNSITIDGEDLEDVKTFTYLGSIIDEHGGSDADVKACIGKTKAAYRQLKDIWNSKNCQPTPRNLENYECHHPEDTSVVYQQLSTQNTSDPLAGHYQQRPTMGENKPDPSGGRNQEEVLEVDRTHIEESTQLRHKTSPHMESSMPKEKRKTKEHTTPGNGERHEKNEQQLNGTRKEDPGQSVLENAVRQPMLHWW
ncbi:unnamed protein product [Schistosoma margrebowiei]|uniref:Uncharacterized protein n=1 Tax=Schistosoma margrebowiei TaxID=48269 RepID=A0A183N0K5_9TREM|nr:unnamed protein product [Schistosoma margrebowiei]